MEKIINKIKQTKGFISIETIVIGGFLIVFGMLCFKAYMSVAGGIVEDSVQELGTNYQDLKPDFTLTPDTPDTPGADGDAGVTR